jgi:hypothetical protein
MTNAGSMISEATAAGGDVCGPDVETGGVIRPGAEGVVPEQLAVNASTPIQALTGTTHSDIVYAYIPCDVGRCDTPFTGR